MTTRSFVPLPVMGICAALLLAAQPASKKPVTIDDVAATHRAEPVAPIWKPDGTAFAYEEKGVVSLYSVSGQETKAVSYTHLGRRAIESARNAR